MAKKKQPAPAAPAFRDRIVELVRVSAASLLANPKNWRVHPKAQRDALVGVLNQVGYADALIGRRLPDGSIELIDGHLRAEVTGNDDVPVLILDVDEQEAALLLATLDPLAAMAKTDSDQLESLLREVQAGDESLGQMLAKLAEQNDIIPRTGAKASDEERGDGMPHQDPLRETVYELIVKCVDEAQQLELFNRLAGEGLDCRMIKV